MSAALEMGETHQAWAVACQMGSGQVERGCGASNRPEHIASGQGALKVARACPGWSLRVHRAMAGAGAHGGHASLVGGPGNIDGGVGWVVDAWGASNGARRCGTRSGGTLKGRGVSQGGREGHGAWFDCRGSL